MEHRQVKIGQRIAAISFELNESFVPEAAAGQNRWQIGLAVAVTV